jgi:hypothetical protein
MFDIFDLEAFLGLDSEEILLLMAYVYDLRVRDRAAGLWPDPGQQRVAQEGAVHLCGRCPVRLNSARPADL